MNVRLRQALISLFRYLIRKLLTFNLRGDRTLREQPYFVEDTRG